MLLEDAFGSGSLLDVKQLLELGPWQDPAAIGRIGCGRIKLIITDITMQRSKMRI